MKSLSLERPQSHNDDDAREELKLKDIIKNVLEEARMVLPGIQALFGFQLIAVFNARFDHIPAIDKTFHLIAIVLTITAIGLLMAPAAYHRHAERNSVSQHFVNYASGLLCFGMAPLMVSICLDTYVVSNIITENSLIATAISVISLLVLSTLWYVIPHVAHKR
jgi:hypothetical protein